MPEKLPLYLDFRNSRLSLKNYPLFAKVGTSMVYVLIGNEGVGGGGVKLILRIPFSVVPEMADTVACPIEFLQSFLSIKLSLSSLPIHIDSEICDIMISDLHSPSGKTSDVRCREISNSRFHYGDVIMDTMASQITSLPINCLLNRLFGCRSKKTSKLRVTGLCAGNSPGTGEFPAQMASNAENVSIWWRHHENLKGAAVSALSRRMSDSRAIVYRPTSHRLQDLDTSRDLAMIRRID